MNKQTVSDKQQHTVMLFNWIFFVFGAGPFKVTTPLNLYSVQVTLFSFYSVMDIYQISISEIVSLPC